MPERGREIHGAQAICQLDQPERKMEAGNHRESSSKEGQFKNPFAETGFQGSSIVTCKLLEGELALEC